MDPWLAKYRCGNCLRMALGAVYEASENAREAHRADILTELDNLIEDLIKLQRDLLELPPQRSAPADVMQEELPF